MPLSSIGISTLRQVCSPRDYPRRTLQVLLPGTGIDSDDERITSLLKYLVVGAGGFLGAITRYLLGNYIGSRYGVRFPYGTFVINMSGCFLIGLILPLLARTTASQYWRYL